MNFLFFNNYSVISLARGEQLRGRFSLHWVTYLLPSLMLSIGLSVILNCLNSPPLILPGALIAATGLVLWLANVSTEMTVTNRRVFIKRGIISRRSDELRLHSVEGVEIEQGLLGRILGFADLKFSGSGQTSFCFRYVDNPLMVKRLVESVVSKSGHNQYRSRRGRRRKHYRRHR